MTHLRTQDPGSPVLQSHILECGMHYLPENPRPWQHSLEGHRSPLAGRRGALAPPTAPLLQSSPWLPGTYHTLLPPCLWPPAFCALQTQLPADCTVINQSIKQSVTNQSIKQTINQPTNQPIDSPLCIAGPSCWQAAQSSGNQSNIEHVSSLRVRYILPEQLSVQAAYNARTWPSAYQTCNT